MKRIYWLIILPALACGAYLAARQLRQAPHPAEARDVMAGMPIADVTGEGLAWLKAEFHLNDDEYRQISALHQAYLPGCMERCRKIGILRDELSALIRDNRTVTPALKAKLEESAQVRAECHASMLAHFYEVAAVMPAAAAKRYLEWVARETLIDSPPS